MKSIKRKIFLDYKLYGKILMAFALITCFSVYQPSLDKAIIGTWVKLEYANSTTKLKNERIFDRNKGGVQFKADGTLSYRQNASWCGTPPITYKNYSGTYTLNRRDSTIDALYQFWGGQMDVKWKIKNISATALELQILEQKTISK